MKNSCIVIPTINIGGHAVESKLFRELAAYTGNRDITKELWALSQIEEFRESFDLEYDENGEVSFESLNRAIDIKSYTKNNIPLKGEKIEAKSIDFKGNIIEYDNPNEAINNATEYNKKNSNYIATVLRKENSYIINVTEKTVDNSDKGAKMIFHNSLNNKLLGILRGLGFDVSVDSNLEYAGMFNPLDTTQTVEGLRTIIRIAEGSEGEAAFPEEFSHVIIAGLQNNNLVSRLMKILTPDVVEEVLGDNYSIYYNKYKGDELMLKKEAAGQLLAKQLTGEHSSPITKNLISRIWDWVKKLFLGISESDIDSVINEANIEAGKLADMITNSSIDREIDKNLILREAKLFAVGNEISGMEKLANKALQLMSKRLKIISYRSKSGEYDAASVNTIRNLQELIEKKKYTASTLTFLSESLAQINDLNTKFKRIQDKDVRADTDINKIRRYSSTLREIKEFADAYVPIIEELISLPSALERGDVKISEEDAKRISEKALEIFGIIKNINSNYKNLRFNTVYSFLKNYWGEDKIIEMGKNKGGTITLKMIMESADKDINGLDRWISSLSDASNPMLSLISKVVKTSHIKRDTIIDNIGRDIRAAHKKLTDAGYTTDFMYERDSKGNLTGRLISNIDFAKFNEERNSYIKELEDKGLNKYQIKAKVEAWERRHMSKEKIKGSKLDRTEMLPDKAQYPSNALSKLSKEQKEYYDTMMEAKALLDDSLPQRYVNHFNAIQISKNITESISDNITDPKKAISLIKDRLKSLFVRQVDETEFGEDSKNLILDFSGNPVDKLPIYYTSPLRDPSLLSTDFSSSMLAYAGMAINYNEMNKIIDVLELTRDLVRDMDVQQTSGGSKLEETFTVLKKKFNNKYVKPGNKTNIGDRLDDYYESVIYGKSKKDEGTIGDSSIDTAKTLDAVKHYTGIIGLGLNAFSAISNVTIGKLQIFIESLGGEYFGYKNSVIGKKNYYKDLPAYLAEINSVNKKSKMSLLINKFDALEEFYSNTQRSNFYQGPMSRIIGNSNLFILNNMGEHYLHTRTMLAMLDNFKVKIGNETKSLYDALEVKETDGVYSLELVKGTTKLDGSAVTESDLENLKLKIGRVNQSLNGAFNEDDKGAIHRYALGRMAMQFRQWMPAHYYRRFSRPYYDAILDQYREGYYTTLGRFIWDTMKDIKRAKFQLATNWKSLTPHQRANMKRSLTELSIFIGLAVLISMMGPEKDKKGVWYERMILYQLKRMELEIGASIPLPTTFLPNVWTILQSPAASIQSFNNMTDLLKFWNMFNEIESGRYKGWSEYERDIVQLIPIYGQIRKLFDLPYEDYMFAIFNKKGN